MFKFLSQLFTGAVPQMDIETYMQDFHQQNNHVMIDVRTPAEFKSGHVAKSKNLPLNTLRDNLPLR